MEPKGKTLSKEISNVVEKAIEDGRNHLNDEEANYLLKMCKQLVQYNIDNLEKITQN